MRWRTVLFEIIPAVLLVILWPTYSWIAERANLHPPRHQEIYLESPALLQIYAQTPKNVADLVAAADAIDREGYTSIAQRVLEAAERVMLAERLGEQAPMPATVGEAARIENENNPLLIDLRKRALPALMASKDAPSWIDSGGARIPEKWDRRPRGQPIENPAFTRRHWGTYLTTSTFRWSVWFVLMIMAGLVTCAVARRICRDEVQFGRAQWLLSIAAFLIVGIGITPLGSSPLLLVIAIPTYVGWAIGFWLGVWAGPRAAVNA